MAEGVVSDLIWRCRMPSFVVEAWESTSWLPATLSQRLAGSIAFGDVMLRYLVAIHAAEQLAMGSPPPSAWRELLERLDTPSAGHWLQALRALAKSLAGEGMPFSSALALGEPQLAAFEAIIQIRNRAAHPASGAVGLEDAAAAAQLPELQRHLRALLGHLRPLARFPLCHVAERRQKVGHVEVVLVRMSGRAPVALPLSLRSLDVPDETPFLLAPSGDALVVAPWVALHGSGPRTTPVLFSRRRPLAYTGAPADAEVRPPFARPPTAEDRLLFRAALPAALATEVAEHRVKADLPSIPGFEFQGRLGEGGNGVVYAALRDGGERVAVKVLRRELWDDATARRRFKREFDLLARLSDPFVVRALGYEEGSEAGPYVVLEHVEGMDLARYAARTKLSEADAVRIVTEVLQALEKVHELGIVHRDVKPSNVMIDRQGHARLLDFGVARDAAAAQLTRTIDAVGTTAYAAPEQLQGRPPDPRMDIYAVGRLLEQLLPGADGDRGTPAVLAVVRMATHGDPQRRFPNARAMIEALSRKDGRFRIAPGDFLNESHRLLAEPAPVMEGLWLASVEEHASGELLSAVIADHDRSRLLARCYRDAPPEVRDHVDLRALLKTNEGMTFALLGGRTPRPEHAIALLRGQVPPPPPAPEAIPAAKEVAPPRTVLDEVRDMPTGLKAVMGAGLATAAAGALLGPKKLSDARPPPRPRSSGTPPKPGGKGRPPVA